MMIDDLIELWRIIKNIVGGSVGIYKGWEKLKNLSGYGDKKNQDGEDNRVGPSSSTGEPVRTASNDKNQNDNTGEDLDTNSDNAGENDGIVSKIFSFFGFNDD